MGTWIETYVGFYEIRRDIVVPLVGTWIETLGISTYFATSPVVPLVGTWIETTLAHLFAEDVL